MKKVLFILFTLVAFIAAFNACQHVPDSTTLVDPNAPGPGTPGGPVSGGGQTCSTDTVYFQNKVLPLLISSCAKSGCHDAASHQDGVELTSYEKIMATADVDPGDPNGSDLYEVLNEDDPDKVMPRPPNNPLTAAEKQLIRNWILQGAKNNACNDCDTATITWSGAVLPIINTHCKGCHNPAFLSAGLDLTSYANVRTIGLNGKFEGVVNHLPGYPAMPRGAAKLDDCKITQIQKWIDAGAQNN